MTTPTSATSHRSHWPWAFVIVAVAALTCVSAPIVAFVYLAHRTAQTVVSLPDRAVNAATRAAADAVRPHIDITTITTTAITSFQKKSKLVVLETQVDVDITKAEGLRSWGVYWGTNKVRLIARENRVQYFIPLEQISTGDFVYNESAQTLTLTVPPPRLDQEMVSVQSDPAKIYATEYTGGWARWDKADTLKHAQEALRPAVIAQGRAPLVQEEANRRGIEAVRAFLEPLLTNVTKDGVKLEVVYRK